MQLCSICEMPDHNWRHTPNHPVAQAHADETHEFTTKRLVVLVKKGPLFSTGSVEVLENAR